MLYAHAVVETEDARYERGQEVPEDLPGVEELREYGSVSEEEYVEPEHVVPLPEEITIDGVRYVQANEGARVGEESL